VPKLGGFKKRSKTTPQSRAVATKAAKSDKTCCGTDGHLAKLINAALGGGEVLGVK